MQIEMPDVAKDQAAAAGFASVEEYVHMLLEKDSDRVAILQGMETGSDGRQRFFPEFVRQFRESETDE